MSLVEAIVLGIVQGLTEFLPISSTAHLRIVPELLWGHDPGAGFTAVIQLGTLAAVLIYFWSDILRILQAFWVDIAHLRRPTNHDSQLAWMIAIGTIPVVIGGLTLKKYIKNDFRSLYVIAAAAIGFALLLMIAEIAMGRRETADNHGRGEGSITWVDVIVVGCFQALALIPGASRSGVTITGGLFVGLSRSAAARFSFLLSIPSVFAAGVYEMYKDRHEIIRSQDDVAALVVATVVSGILGYASIAFLIGYLKKHTTYVFIIYRIALGIAILLLLSRGMIKALPDSQL